MKRTLFLPLLCASVLLAGCASRAVREKAARESLEAAVRLVRSGSDAGDEALLAPALEYYPEHGDATARTKLWYCLGRIQLRRGAYAEAGKSLEKAEQAALEAGDLHAKGLVDRALADLYNLNFNVREDTLYLRLALAAFEAAGDTLYAAETCLRLAAAFYNARDWDQAAEALDRVASVCRADAGLRPRFQSIYGTFLLDSPPGGRPEALACLDSALSSGLSFPPAKDCDWAYALFLNGEEGRALRVLDSLERAHPEGLPQLDYRKYCLYKQKGDYRRALSFLEKNIVQQDSLFHVQASELVSRARRDYLAVVAEEEHLEAQRELDRRRKAVAGGALAAVILVLIGIIVYQEERTKRLTVQQILSDTRRLVERLKKAGQDYRNKIHGLHRDVRNTRSALAEVRAEFLHMFRSGFLRLGNLFEARHFASTQEHSEAVLCRKVGEILKEIDGDKEGMSRFRQFIEENLDRPIAHLKEDIPDLGEPEIRLFCYLIAGFDASLISLLTGVDNLNTVYSRKSRLLGRIRRLPPARSARYLDLMS